MKNTKQMQVHLPFTIRKWEYEKKNGQSKKIQDRASDKAYKMCE